MEKKWICSTCDKIFASRSTRDRHVRTLHKASSPLHVCPECNRTFSRKDSLGAHMKLHQNKRKDQDAKDTQSKKLKLDFTPSTSKTTQDRDTPSISKSKLTNFCVEEIEEADQAAGDLEEEVKTIFKENWSGIKTHSRPGKTESVYNFRWSSDQSTPDWKTLLQPIFNNSKHRFKINASHGFILMNQHSNEEKEDDEENEENKKFRYYHACHNNAALFDKPRTINNQADFDAFVQELENLDHLEYARQERPDSKWTVHNLTNTSIYINPMQDFPIGCSADPIPSYIKNSHGLYALEKDYNNQFRFKDNLCFFRCLALHQGATLYALERPTKDLFKKWKHKFPAPVFEGITMTDLEKAETLFEVNVDVFEFDEEENPPVIVPLRRTQNNHQKTMKILKYEEHFCYIHSIDRVGHAFACPKCKKLWTKSAMLIRHQKTCTGEGQKNVYPGGVYTPPPTPLQILERNGIDVDTSAIFPYRATFDFECLFEKDNLPKSKKNNSKTRYTARHVPMSVSVSSNVPGYEQPAFFINKGDPQILVNEMVDHLEAISLKSFDLMKEEYADVYDQISQKEQEAFCSSESSPMADEEKERGTRESNHLTSSISSWRKTLDDYLQELPVVGFNSQNYDINLIKPYLFKRLSLTQQPHKANEMMDTDADDMEEKEEQEEQEEDDMGKEEDDDMEEEGEQARELTEEGDCAWVNTNTIKFLVKNNNQYKCIATPTLKFLDITSYLAPGCSYSQYLKAFDVPEEKGFFPYEYVTSLECLQETSLPPRSAFYSSLKDSEISIEDYEFCQNIWKDHNMNTMADFLRWYNNKDTLPLLLGLEKQSLFYKDLELDMFKDGIGVPGLTLRFLFKTMPPNVYFSLFHEKQKDIHSLLRSNMVGGPSMIFHRYHEKDKTTIRRKEGKTVKTLEGYDANALYLWALSQNMPTGNPTIRKKDNCFQPEKVDKFGQMAREWLEWISSKSGRHIYHKYNGKEQQFGKRRIRVDGWDAVSKTAYQFHGCAFHACDKCADGQKPFPHPFKPEVPREELLEKTKDISKYLRESVGVNVVEMWECEWRKQKKHDRRIKAFLKSKNLLSSYKSPFNKKQKEDGIKDKDIVNAIKADKLFGLIQCDVEVPSGLRDHFSEMQPIFKNAEISKNDIGEIMKAYADKHKLLSQPRRTLIGSYFGKEILIATPLLKWYLNHGLVIKDIQMVIEYEPSACFQKFAVRVSNARRSGDRDPKHAILAETMKLIGNSGYGKTLTNISNHTNVVFVNNNDAQKKHNSPLYKKTTPLGSDLNEVESKKPILKHNLPLQIGYFVYQYAKLRMLEFHFDLIDKFIDRADYQLCEMDTDSYYAVFSTPNLETAVRPELRRTFFEEYHHWFPSPTCDDHRQDFVNARVANQDWVPKGDCCLDRKAFDKRTPGLFKLEYKGDGIVALCSKTYYCFGKDSKFSCKGLNKKLNDLTKEKYLKVLKEQESSGGTNKGFQTDGKTIHTYEQQRDALSYFYIKRQIQEDGVSTKPIEI